MLKKLLLIFFTLGSFACCAQNNTSLIPIPMKNGIICYEKTYTLQEGSNKEELFNNALKWLKKSFPESTAEPETSDQKAGKIDGTGIYKIITSNSGNYYWIKFSLAIAVSDSSYSLKAYNFYEKPVESGISNEYSKIEYRWWDYRQGKPWSAEDQKLFTGLHTDLTGMIASFEKAMGQ